MGGFEPPKPPSRYATAHRAYIFSSITPTGQTDEICIQKYLKPFVLAESEKRAVRLTL